MGFARTKNNYKKKKSPRNLQRINKANKLNDCCKENMKKPKNKHQ